MTNDQLLATDPPAGLANADSTASSAAPAVPPSRPLPTISLRRALVFPFTQRNWPHALTYMAAIQFLPIVGYLISRGWRYDIARRLGSGHSESLPDWRHWREHLRQGTLLFLVTQFHFLPMYVALWRQRSGVFWTVVGLIDYAYRSYTESPQLKTLWEIVEPGLESLAIFFAILLLVPPLISAIVESATQRYAQTGQVVTLLEVWKSVQFAWRDLYDVVRIEASIVGLTLAVWGLSLLLTLTVGGTIFVPAVMIPVYMWTRGALMGQWICRNRAEDALAAARSSP